jgi:hypothetical protein
MAERTSSAAKMMLIGSTSSNDGKGEANLVTRKSLPSSSTSSTIRTSSTSSPIVRLDYTQSSNDRSRLQNQFKIYVNNPQNFASSSTSEISQRFTEMPENISTTFFGLHMSSKNASNPSESVETNIEQTINDSIAADPNFTTALASAITFIMRSSQSTCSATTSSAAANGTGSNDKGKQQN